MDNDINAVFTEHIGALPMIVEYLKRIKFVENIDNQVDPLRSNNKRLSHGKTCFIFVLYLLCRPHVTYKVEEWIEETTYLKVIFPEIAGNHFSDDKLDDTFKALYKAGIRNLFSGQSINVIKEFNLSLKQIHCDFTSFTVDGYYDETDEQEGIKITYGFSKEHRPDKKQFMQEVAVTNDGGVPLATQSLDGNTADVTRYIPVWKELKECMGSSDFIMVGDCKLSSEDNLIDIMKGDGYFLAPLAMYNSEKEDLRDQVLNNKGVPQVLLKKKKGTEEIVYTGFEVPAIITDKNDGKIYKYRKIYVHSSELEKEKLSTLNRRIESAEEDLEKLCNQINHLKKLDSKEKITEKAEFIINSNKVDGIIDFEIEDHVQIEKKKIGRGKPCAESKYEESKKVIYELKYSINIKAKEEAEKLCGYFILATNKPAEELSMKEALTAYKQEWKVERIWANLKGPLQVVPIYLQLPQHIEAMLYLLMTCAQVFTLVDREAKNTLAARAEVMAGLFPNKITTKSPKCADMMDKLSNVSLTYIIIDGKVKVYVSELNPLQKRILDITNVCTEGFETSYIENMLNKNGILSKWLKNTLIVFGLKVKAET